jgi:hypothetical protein
MPDPERASSGGSGFGLSADAADRLAKQLLRTALTRVEAWRRGEPTPPSPSPLSIERRPKQARRPPPPQQPRRGSMGAGVGGASAVAAVRRSSSGAAREAQQQNQQPSRPPLPEAPAPPLRKGGS